MTKTRQYIVRLKRLRVLESFVNVDSSTVRCLGLAVLRQHVAVAVALALTLVDLLTTLHCFAMHRPMRSSHLLGRNTVSVQHITPQTTKAKVPHEASLPHITETTLRYVHFTIFLHIYYSNV